MLTIQIIQTRILSVVSLYYMAFFSISMAMLGLTAGALIVYYKLDHVNPQNVDAFLSRISTGFALCIAAPFALQLASPLPNAGGATYVVLWVKAIVLLAAPFTGDQVAVPAGSRIEDLAVPPFAQGEPDVARMGEAKLIEEERPRIGRRRHVEEVTRGPRVQVLQVLRREHVDDDGVGRRPVRAREHGEVQPVGGLLQGHQVGPARSCGGPLRWPRETSSSSSAP